MVIRIIHRGNTDITSRASTRNSAFIPLGRSDSAGRGVGQIARRESIALLLGLPSTFGLTLLPLLSFNCSTGRRRRCRSSRLRRANSFGSNRLFIGPPFVPRYRRRRSPRVDLLLEGGAVRVDCAFLGVDDASKNVVKGQLSICGLAV